MKKKILRIAIIVACGITLFIFGCGNGQSKSVQKTNNDLPVMKTAETKNTKSIPHNFISINVQNQIIYVPKEYKKIEIPHQYADMGIALLGGVWKKVDDPKEAMTEHYDVKVMFEKAADLRRMKPDEEDQVLEIIYKNSWDARAKAANKVTKKELVSKEICRNIDGHKYLKTVAIFGDPNRPHLDMVDRSAIYIFDDTIYFVSTNELVRANNKYAAEMDCILDTFGSTRRQEVRQTVTKEDILPQKASIGTEAVSFFKKYHEAITNKDFEYAFNCLSPNLQRELGGFDKYFEGFITTVSSRVQSAEILSVQENTVVIKYVLKAEDFGESKNADIVEQRFSGKAVLKKFDGIWKIVDNRAKRL